MLRRGGRFTAMSRRRRRGWVRVPDADSLPISQRDPYRDGHCDADADPHSKPDRYADSDANSDHSANLFADRRRVGSHGGVALLGGRHVSISIGYVQGRFGSECGG